MLSVASDPHERLDRFGDRMTCQSKVAISSLLFEAYQFALDELAEMGARGLG
jgi:hypothetical protein